MSLQHRGRTLGVYNLFFADAEEPSPEIQSILRSIGELLGLALNNARLEQENMRSTLMAERQMMAAEVHDSLAQSLAFAKMRMPLLHDAMLAHDDARAQRYYDEVRRAMTEAHASLRGILTHFRVPMDPQGLVHALGASAEDFRRSTGTELDFVNELPGLKLSAEQETQVFHIVQEALTNVARHANAQHAQLAHCPGPAGRAGDRRRGRRRRPATDGRQRHALRHGNHGRARAPSRRHPGGRCPPGRRHAGAVDVPGACDRRGHGCRGGCLMVAPRIILVDDHALCRTGLTDLLHHRGNITVVAALGNPDQVAPALREHQPDLLVLDLRMPTTDGLTLLRRAACRGLRHAGADPDDERLRGRPGGRAARRRARLPAQGHGARGRDRRDRPRRARRADGGAGDGGPSWRRCCRAASRAATGRAPLASLTERERQILDHLARGESNKAIAANLDISHDTVKLHVRHILSKLNLSSRVEAAVFAVESRLGADSARANSRAALEP